LPAMPALLLLRVHHQSITDGIADARESWRQEPHRHQASILPASGRIAGVKRQKQLHLDNTTLFPSK
jgi:hypothetical protein